MDERLAAAWAALPERLSAHVLLSTAALATAVALSLPLALLALSRPRLRGAVLGTASAVQTVPGLALVALFYPLLLAVGAATAQSFGWRPPALGFIPAWMALSLYAMLPILRNAVAGFGGLDPAVLQAADAVGMTRRQRLLRVEAPLAAPVVMAGVRTAAVLTVGTAVLSTPVGQPSLGDYIFSGLQTEDWTAVLFGCAASAGLALVVDAALGLVEAAAARRDLRQAWTGGAILAAGVLAALIPSFAGGRPGYVIGAKNFGEQFVLSELMARRLRAAGADATIRSGLGSAVIHRALAAGELDAYVDYSGTLWTNVLGRKDTPPRAQLLAQLTAELRRRDGVVVVGSLGFENAYALAMRAEDAKRLDIGSLTALARHAPDLRLASDLEFLNRPEWKALQSAYGLRFKASRSYTPTFMYRALEDGTADVATAFSSDGRLAGGALVALTDDRSAVPTYDAVLLVSPRRAGDRRLLAALRPLVGAITPDAMRAANADVDLHGRTPAAVAEVLARKMSSRAAEPTRDPGVQVARAALGPGSPLRSGRDDRAGNRRVERQP